MKKPTRSPSPRPFIHAHLDTSLFMSDKLSVSDPLLSISLLSLSLYTHTRMYSPCLQTSTHNFLTFHPSISYYLTIISPCPNHKLLPRYKRESLLSLSLRKTFISLSTEHKTIIHAWLTLFTMKRKAEEGNPKHILNYKSEEKINEINMEMGFAPCTPI